MKLVCDGLALAEAVLKVSKAMPVKKSNPILEGIKLVAKDGSLTLTATDLELSIVNRIDARVLIEGEALVLGRYFAEFVKSLPADEITLECANGKNLTIRYGDNEGFIKCADIDQYPSVDRIQDGSFLTMKKDDLNDVINKVAFAASLEDTRATLKGVLFELTAGNLTAVALDAYRLSMCKKSIGDDVQDAKYIIPARTLNEMQRLLDASGETVSLLFSADKVMVELDNTQMISRLIEGEYINYRNIVSSSGSATVATLSRDSLSDSVNRAGIIVRADKNNALRIEVSEGLVKVDARSDFGNVHESIPATIDGKDVITHFKCRYIQDVLNAITDEFITISFKTASSPCIITNPANDEYLFLILPMRVGA